ncbi:MAG TPA: nucleoid-associated protein, YbaB/EbfC family, partial [Planctomycetaceae bacterium]|nr:nucleoid-associated protein, YbaB/EbfC family [Planctomycetaceae bacterium]
MLKGLGNIATLMKQAQEMGGKMQEMQEQLKQQRVIGTAGAGLVEVEMNGHGEVLRLKIDPTLVAKADGEMIED